MLHQYLKWQQNWCSLPLWGLLQDLVFHTHKNVLLQNEHSALLAAEQTLSTACCRTNTQHCLLQNEHSTLFAAGLGLPNSHNWLVAGPGVPHSQECGPTPDHCQEAQLESLGSQQETGLEGMARQQEAHQCVPLLTSGLPHCAPFQCLERTKRGRLKRACAFWHPKIPMGLPCG